MYLVIFVTNSRKIQQTLSKFSQANHFIITRRKDSQPNAIMDKMMKNTPEVPAASFANI